MKKPHLGISLLTLFYLGFISFVNSQPNDDASVMLKLKESIGNPSFWPGSDPCNGNWKHVTCDSSNRVTDIQIGRLNLVGTLPPELVKLTALKRIEVMFNNLTGSVPNLAGLSSLQVVILHDNGFSSFPAGFFDGLNSITTVSLDYNPFEPWEIPSSLVKATTLKEFSANGANLIGKVPDFLNNDVFPGLESLHLAMNSLEGELPDSFAKSSVISSLWLNGQKSSSQLNGSIWMLQNMTGLTEIWLHKNQFTGPLPDFSGFNQLQQLSLRDNGFTGVVPDSLVKLPTLAVVNLTNNLLQGPTPAFPDSIQVDMRSGSNRFCTPNPGVPCDPRVDVLLSIVKDFGYPASLADSWEGNDPCAQWKGITCSPGGNITVINFQNMGLTGTISPNFKLIPSLQKLILANNLLSGTIPSELATMPSLSLLNIANNRVHGKVPDFKRVQVITDGNVDIGKDSSSFAPPGLTPGSTPSSERGGGGGGSGESGNKSSSTGKIVGSVVAVVCGLCVVGLGVFFFNRKQKRYSKVQSPNMVIHPRHSNNQDAVKITVAESSGNDRAESVANSNGSSDLHVVEAGNMMISIQVLRNVTNNFNEKNILGKGGFGTVYKGELHDGTKIAVKRMESGLMSETGLAEFTSEIEVLNKVRHRHLVALLGYCLDGNERLLVYEYMPQGPLSNFLFNWKEEGLKPLEWTRRLTIALDVARGVEYLHGLAHQSFIHRDLKPSNILLGDDMRAKVADFGLVRLAPEGGKASFHTRLAGTFGYLAPEYAATGRVTTKVDVFSFGVILMEIITGRRALDSNQPEDSMQLVTWFRRMHNNKDTSRKTIDSTIELDEETLASISTVSELAGHCTSREPSQRPDMGHVVNVLSSLVEIWKPAEQDPDGIFGIDLDMTLPQVLKKWQDFEGRSNIDGVSFSTSGDNTQTSIPTRPSGFADSFTSADGR